ncbi:MAG TPA: hypothetical protein VJ810_38950 [Blastocatellia bacterium]|nr:hypothetical protein [Blastocatellia bacterium]
MKLNHSRSRAFSWFLALALALSAALSNSPAALADDFVYNKAWTTVGSAGTVDDADAGKLVFQGSSIAFPDILQPQPFPTAQTAHAASNALIPLPTQTTTATIRYNVTAVDGLFTPGAELGMTVRYRDDGGWAQVLARLYEQDIYTGATNLLLTFDSNAFITSPNYQTQSVGVAVPYPYFDFNQKAYFIEATLTKTSSSISINGGRPGLAIIKLNTYYRIN